MHTTLRTAVLCASVFAAGAAAAAPADTPADGRTRDPYAPAYEISVAYVWRNGELHNADPPNGYNFYPFVGYLPYYYNRHYGIAYADAPRVSARVVLWRYLWLGLSAETFRAHLSAELDTRDGPAAVPHVGTLDGWRASLAVGGRLTLYASSPHPLVLYGGYQADLDRIDLISDGFCLSDPCERYRLEGSAKNGSGLVLGLDFAMTRTVSVLAEVLLRNKAWDFNYRHEGTDDVLLDHDDHVDLIDRGVSAALTYRFGSSAR